MTIMVTCLDRGLPCSALLVLFLYFCVLVSVALYLCGFTL